MAELTGKVAVITGASSGVGAATAVALHAAGAKVMLGARRGPRLKEIVAELGEDTADYVEMDVRRPDAAGELVDAAIARFGRLDILVANAGIGCYGGILEHSERDVRELVETNLTGTIWSVQAAVPYLLGGGDIVIVSSVAGLRGKPNEAVYAATKHGLVGFAGSLDRELYKHDVRVVTLCPGAVATEFALGRGRNGSAAEASRMLTAENVAQAVRTVLAQPRSMRSLLWSMRSMVAEN